MTRVNVWFIGVLLAVLLLVTYVPVTGMGLVELFLPLDRMTDARFS